MPPCSTMFWQPDKALIRDDDAKRIRYRYPGPDGGRTVTFVGYQEPLPEIPAGTLLRISLAHWWRPEQCPMANCAATSSFPAGICRRPWIVGWLNRRCCRKQRLFSSRCRLRPPAAPAALDMATAHSTLKTRLWLRRLPLAAGGDHRQHPPQTGYTGDHAHRQRQITLLPAARPALPRPDRRRLAADLVDAGPGGPATGIGRGGRFPQQHPQLRRIPAHDQQHQSRGCGSALRRPGNTAAARNLAPAGASAASTA